MALPDIPMDEGSFAVPLIIRGRVIDSDPVRHGGRGSKVTFTSADVGRYAEQLALASPSALEDLYRLRFEEILDFLEALGERLTLEKNPWIQQAFELSSRTSGLSRPILQTMYESIKGLPVEMASPINLGLTTGAGTGGSSSQSSLSGLLKIDTKALAKAVQENPSGAAAMMTQWSFAFGKAKA